METALQTQIPEFKFALANVNIMHRIYLCMRESTVLTQLMFVCALIFEFKLRERDNIFAEEAIICANFPNIKFRKSQERHLRIYLRYRDIVPL